MKALKPVDGINFKNENKKYNFAEVLINSNNLNISNSDC